MEFFTSDVQVLFNPICECGHRQTQLDTDGNQLDCEVAVPVADLVDAGTPICEECGADLMLADKVEVTVTNHTNESDTDLESIAQSIYEDMDFQEPSSIVVDHIYNRLCYKEQSEIDDLVEQYL